MPRTLSKIRSSAMPTAALILWIASSAAIAQGGAGNRDRPQTRGQDQMRTIDQDRLQDQDRLHDQDRLRIHQDSRLQADQDRLREMDRTRDRIHQEKDAAKRAELHDAYRRQIHEGMAALRDRKGLGPEATQQERMQHMEQQLWQMQELMQHTWEYQNRENPEQREDRPD